jgi:squalene synthase HpnC
MSLDSIEPLDQHPAEPWESLADTRTENFHVLSAVLPKRFHDDFRTVYAFCRIADDLADPPLPTRPSSSAATAARANALANLQRFRDALTEALESPSTLDSQTKGRPNLWFAITTLVEQQKIAPRHLHDLLDAFDRDQHQLRYSTWPDLLSYCRKSADPVGRMVLSLAGVRDSDPRHAELIAQSDTVCTALQLVNHIQDVRRDLVERDRIYLPSAETNLTASDLYHAIEHPLDHETRVRVIRAVRPLLLKTKAMFEHTSNIHTLVRESAASPLSKAIWLFHRAGLALCTRIERTGCTTLYRRPVLRKRARLALLLRAGIQ